MIIVHATIPVAADQRDTFLGAIKGLVEASNAEPGIRTYDCYESATRPNVFIFVEEYDDEDALNAHLASEHFQAAAAGLPGFASGPPELNRFDSGEPQPLM
jgi:quinol monooxygenase YgiN